MASEIQLGDSLAKKQRSDVISQITDGSVAIEIKSGLATNEEVQKKPGEYIALEGRSLEPVQPNTLISSLRLVPKSKDSAINISKTFSLSPSCSKKALIPQKVQFVQKRNASAKGIVQSPKKHESEVAMKVKRTFVRLNLKHKTDCGTVKTNKRFKPDCSTKHSTINSYGKLPNDFIESNFDSNSQEELNNKNVTVGLGGNVSSAPKNVNETWEKVIVKNSDHNYSQLGNFDSNEITEDELVNDSLENYLVEEHEEEIVGIQTKQNSLQEDLNAEEVDSSSRDISFSDKNKDHAQLKTLAPVQSNLCGRNHRNTQGQPVALPCTSKSVYVGGSADKKTQVSAQNKKARVSEKLLKLPVPSDINQYGDCLKTRMGRYHYGLTMNDPPCQFFQGVLKGASGQTLAAMFGDINLFAKFQSISLDEIGDFVIDTTFKVIPNSTKGINKVFTISLLHQNVLIPVWYAITSCSSSELYKRILIEFQQHVIDWPFTSVLLNNDPLLCKAVKAVFPDVDIYGSWFYYCYSIWKEVNLQSLTGQCKSENSTLLTAVKLLMVVPYLPPSTRVNSAATVSMEDGLEYIRTFARENSLPKEFSRVFNYVVVFWFNTVKPENFTMFGKHTSSTLNHVEVMQLFLLSYMKQSGDVWTLTRSFQAIARATYTDFIKFLNGKRMLPKIRGKNFNVPIRQNMKKLMAGSLDVKTYLEKSTVYLDEILDIFLHPLYPTTSFEKTNYIHTEGWAVKICSN